MDNTQSTGTGVKVQINSLAALERLIGDEPQLEMEVRKSVMEAFARGALKNVVNAEAVAGQLASIEKEVIKQVDTIASKALEVKGITEKRPNGWRTTKVVIPDDQKAAIRRAVESAAYDLIQETIEKIDYARITNDAVSAAINTYIVHQVRNFLKSGLQDSINAAIAAVLEEKDEVSE